MTVALTLRVVVITALLAASGAAAHSARAAAAGCLAPAFADSASTGLVEWRDAVSTVPEATSATAATNAMANGRGAVKTRRVRTGASTA